MSSNGETGHSGALSVELLHHLAAYGEFPLPTERVEALHTALAKPLADLRRIRPADYDALAPITAFSAPRPGPSQ